MARKPAKKPAGKKPAAKRPAESANVTIKAIAERVGKDPKSVRAYIRRRKGGAVVGRGGRYGWNSFNDPEVKGILAGLSK